jgi:putative transposase
MPKRKHFSASQKAQIALEILKEEKTVIQIASEYGVHPNVLYRWKRQALDNLPKLFEDENKGERDRQAEHERQVNELYSEIGRLTTQLNWLKKNLATVNRAERLAMLEPHSLELSFKAQTELLGVSRSSLYYQPAQPSPEEVAIKHRIDEIYTRWPFYGSRRITVVLNREEIAVSRPTVQHYMREMGISGIAPGPNTSKPAPEHTIYPYLLRHVSAEYPNHVWGIDITYIRLKGGWMYLVAVLDWFSRYVVAWELDQTLELPFVLNTVDRALQQAIPTIWNSDQGSHFTSSQYLDRLLIANVKVSMDGRGRAADNIFTERLWRSVKYEEVYLNDYVAPRDARYGLARYFRFYNFERPHQALNYQTPAQVYAGKDQAVLYSTLRKESTLQ